MIEYKGYKFGKAEIEDGINVTMDIITMPESMRNSIKQRILAQIAMEEVENNEKKKWQFHREVWDARSIKIDYCRLMVSLLSYEQPKTSILVVFRNENNMENDVCIPLDLADCLDNLKTEIMEAFGKQFFPDKATVAGRY